MSRCKGKVLFLQLGEEADVLDRDDGLVGKGLEQGDLTVREGARGPTGDRDDTDGSALVDHRHGDNRSQPDTTMCLVRQRFQLLGLDIRNVDNCGIDERSRHDRCLTARGLWEKSRRFLSGARTWIVLRCEMKEFAVVARDDAVLAAAQPAGASHDDVENRLGVGR